MKQNNSAKIHRFVSYVLENYSFRVVIEDEELVMAGSNGKFVVIYLFLTSGTIDIYQRYQGEEKALLLSMNPDDLNDRKLLNELVLAAK